MGEPLSPDHVFDFPEDELEPHPAYDFFVPALLPGYVDYPNNNNGWLEADDYQLGELKAIVDEQMVVPAIEEVAEPVAEAEEEQVIAPIVDIEEVQMDVPMIEMEEDLATLFDDDDFEDDASDGVYDVGGPSTTVAEGPSFLHLAPGLSILPFVIEDLSTRLGNLEYGHGQLVQRINQVNDADVAASVTIGELGPRIYAVKGYVQVMASQMVYAADKWEQVGA
uniref:Uncharacterized protein n=1 Tax=Tanacetum cinerariifolium TaxID=118510 RepID=A0A6L2NZD4_TANCI|nr:hypothetical protein [Tanacetum cinerariifolium]